MKAVERIFKEWITSIVGLILIAGAGYLLYTGKITMNEFTAFLPFCIGLFWAKNTFLTDIFKKGGGGANLLLAFVLSASLSSCKHTQQLPATPSVVTSNTTSSEASGGTSQTGYTKPDSSMIVALFECDSLGRIRMKEIEMLRAGATVKPEVQVKDNYITLKCKVDSAAVFTMWSRFYEAKTDTIKYVKYLPGTVTNRLNGFQRIMVTAGIIACVALILFIVLRLQKTLLI